MNRRLLIMGILIVVVAAGVFGIFRVLGSKVDPEEWSVWKREYVDAKEDIVTALEFTDFDERGSQCSDGAAAVKKARSTLLPSPDEKLTDFVDQLLDIQETEFKSCAGKSGDALFEQALGEENDKTIQQRRDRLGNIENRIDARIETIDRELEKK